MIIIDIIIIVNIIIIIIIFSNANHILSGGPYDSSTPCLSEGVLSLYITVILLYTSCISCSMSNKQFMVRVQIRILWSCLSISQFNRVGGRLDTSSWQYKSSINIKVSLWTLLIDLLWFRWWTTRNYHTCRIHQHFQGWFTVTGTIHGCTCEMK